MVEARHNKTNLCSWLVPIGEHILFQALKQHFHVADNPKSPHTLKFSWDNCRGDDARVLARLDRFYLFQCAPGNTARTILSYAIRGNSVRSDHCPVEFTIQLEERVVQKSRWKMNVTWMEEACANIGRICISQSPDIPFFSKLKVVMKFYRAFCKRKASSFKLDEM